MSGLWVQHSKVTVGASLSGKLQGWKCIFQFNVDRVWKELSAN